METEDALTKWIGLATDEIQHDLAAYCLDPASGGLVDNVYRAYGSFRAVAGYRLAHQIATDPASSSSPGYGQLARSLSENIKVQTGVEIHPLATIGKRFVVDHGFNTVIGETCVIGENVLILNNVVLGAEDGRDHRQGRRHPSVGNNVKIAGHVRILGPVCIGNNVTIGAGVQIAKRDIPDDYALSLITTYQFERRQQAVPGPHIYGLVPSHQPGFFTIYGRSLGSATVDFEIITRPNAPLCGWVRTTTRSDQALEVELLFDANRPAEPCHPVSVSIDGQHLSSHIPASQNHSPVLSARLVLRFPDERIIALETRDLLHLIEAQITGSAP